MQPGEHSEQHRDTRIDVPDGLPDPVLAGIFAFFGIALGQFYNGRPIRGICWGIVGFALVLLLHQSILFGPAGFFFVAACALDAYSTAQEIQNRIISWNGIHSFFWVEILLILSLCIAFGIKMIVDLIALNGIPV